MSSSQDAEFPFFFSKWHRIQLLNVLWLLKGSWIFQVNNLREELQSLAVRPVTVVTSATKSGQCLFMVSVNEMHWGHCIWLLCMIRIEQLSQTQVCVTQLLYVWVQSKHTVDENYVLVVFIYSCCLVISNAFVGIDALIPIKYTWSNNGHSSIVCTLYNSDWSLLNIIVIISPSSVGPGACTLTAIVVAGVIVYAYIKWKVRFDSFILLKWNHEAQVPAPLIQPFFYQLKSHLTTVASI